MISTKDALAIGNIIQCLTNRFSRTRSERNRQLVFKQIIYFVDLAIKLNTGAK